MSSAVELIHKNLLRKRKEASQKAQDEKDKRNRDAQEARNKQRDEKQAIHDKRMRLRSAKELADRILRTSGVLDEMEAVRKKYMGWKTNSATFVNYDEGRAELILVWGKTFSVKEDKNGHKFVDYRQEIERGQTVAGRSKDYSLMSIYVDLEVGDILIGSKVIDELTWRTDRQQVSNALADYFDKPFRVLYTSKEKVGLQGTTTMVGGPSDLSRGGDLFVMKRKIWTFWKKTRIYL